VLGLTQQLSAISTQDSGHQMGSDHHMDSGTTERTVTNITHNPFGSPHSVLAEGSSSGTMQHHHGLRLQWTLELVNHPPGRVVG